MPITYPSDCDGCLTGGNRGAIGKEYPKVKCWKLLIKKSENYSRNSVLEHGKRVSGLAGVNELRPISAKYGLLPRTHGTGLFNAV